MTTVEDASMISRQASHTTIKRDGAACPNRVDLAIKLVLRLE